MPLEYSFNARLQTNRASNKKPALEIGAGVETMRVGAAASSVSSIHFSRAFLIKL